MQRTQAGISQLSAHSNLEQGMVAAMHVCDTQNQYFLNGLLKPYPVISALAFAVFSVVSSNGFWFRCVAVCAKMRSRDTRVDCSCSMTSPSSSQCSLRDGCDALTSPVQGSMYPAGVSMFLHLTEER